MSEAAKKLEDEVGSPAGDAGAVAKFPSIQPVSPSPTRRRPLRRIALILLLPLCLAVVGGYFWITSGRYVSTDDAYVQQDKVTVASEVSGTIVAVGAAENAKVDAGDLLFQIDPSAYEAAESQAAAAVASARLDVERLKAAYGKSVSDREASKQALIFARDTFDRQNALAKRGVIAQSALDKARLDLQQAEAAVHAADQAVLAAKAALAGDPDIETDAHPEVRAAEAQLEKARLDVAHTRVVAPAAGVVTQTDRLQVGQYVSAGSPVLSLVETGTTWIEANFKETDLAHLRAGQPVDITVDTYPGRDIEGQVESVGAGTGAEFSLLPAQNATGNWVKVVQRIPVRISLSQQPGMPILRTGMSATVSVDTRRGRMLAVGAEQPSQE